VKKVSRSAKVKLESESNYLQLGFDKIEERRYPRKYFKKILDCMTITIFFQNQHKNC